MNKKILIAEDDQFISKIMKFNLVESGCDVDHACDGEQAEKMIAKNQYNLILLDMIMPVKTGFEVLKSLKEKGNTVPILVFSNLSQDKDKQEALGMGAKDYFIKSNMSIDELVAKVNEYL